MDSQRFFSAAFVPDEKQQGLSLLLASTRSPGTKEFVLDEHQMQGLPVCAHNLDLCFPLPGFQILSLENLLSSIVFQHSRPVNSPLVLPDGRLQN